MALVRLVYVSTKHPDLDYDGAQSILNKARENNTTNNITGLLCFNRKYFLQVLEGDREKVSRLYNTISNDGRHSNTTLIHCNEINEREFENWSMGYVPESSLTSAVILKYSSESEFNPYNMSSGNIVQMMRCLRDVIPAA